ncbi:MAG: hypothetical protein LBQ83_01105 [Candidatus Margulisbacteria bacterium]|jgi:hypothetical protein|nr:hypothetical protein [Candidatus Margulisiibacteriota bacterium]
MKPFLKIICGLAAVVALAGANGSLNVFTGDKEAEVFIDGQFVAREQALNHALPAGTHYIQVKKNNRVIRSRTVEVQDGRLETVVLDDFVDYKTNVASRGALDVEAMRVRETRGNFGFGLYGGSPASGLSLKWWPWEKFGFQALGYVNTFDGNEDTRFGLRLLCSLNESVYKNSTFTTFLALGGGRSMLANNIDDQKNEIYDIQEAALGIEFKIADFFSTAERQDRYIILNSQDEGASPYISLLTAVVLGIGEGLLKFGHIALELGVEHVRVLYLLDKADTEHTAVKVSGGFHIYF